MRSALPKVLHPVCGKPMVEWVIDAAREAGAAEVICITRPGDGVAEGLPDVGHRGRAAHRARARVPRSWPPGSAAPADGTVLVLSGDHPLLSAETIGEVVDTHAREQAAATLLTTEELDPAGYGRIVRASDGSVERIVETKHTEGLSAEELAHARGQPRHLCLRGVGPVERPRRGGRGTRRDLPHRRLPDPARARTTAGVTPHRRTYRAPWASTREPT